MKKFLLNILKKYHQKLKDVDYDFWEDIYSNDLEELDNV